MEKQTKNIITREWIEKELRFYNTADIKSMLVICVVTAPIFLPITVVVVVYGTLSFFEGLFVKIVFSVFFGGLISSAFWIPFSWLLVCLIKRRMILRGEFDVVVREVLYKSERLVHRHLEELLHFQGFKEISVGHTAFQLASSGDLYYIVHYKNKNSIALCYSVKMYELQ